MHHRSACSSSNAVIADVGICVGMRNVNLNRSSTCFINNVPHYCKYAIPRPLIPPNWYTNYEQCDEYFSKYLQMPVLLSNGMNALVVNEYTSANMRDEIVKFRQSASTTHSVSPTAYWKSTVENEWMPTASKSVTVNRNEISDSTLAPPKKKWIRHYMMGE